MTKTKLLLMTIGIITLVACGPETILVRPSLDTPSQHLSNGHKLLNRGKVEDAYREFNRARELDPACVEAHIGIGLVMGHKGDVDNGLKNLQRAEALAKTAEEHSAVRQGYADFNAIIRSKSSSPK